MFVFKSQEEMHSRNKNETHRPLYVRFCARAWVSRGEWQSKSRKWHVNRGASLRLGRLLRLSECEPRDREVLWYHTYLTRNEGCIISSMSPAFGRIPGAINCLYDLIFNWDYESAEGRKDRQIFFFKWWLRIFAEWLLFIITYRVKSKPTCFAYVRVHQCLC